MSGQLKRHLRQVVAASDGLRAARELLKSEGGRMLSEGREELGLTQEQMGEKLGITNVYISKIENGHSDLTVPLAVKLAGLLQQEAS